MRNFFISSLPWLKVNALNFCGFVLIIFLLTLLAFLRLVNLDTAVNYDASVLGLGLKSLTLSQPNKLLDNYSTSKEVADIAVIIFWVIMACGVMAVVKISSDILNQLKKLREESHYQFPRNHDRTRYIVSEIVSHTIRYVCVVALVYVSMVMLNSLIPNFLASIQSRVAVEMVLSLIPLAIGAYMMLVNSRIFFRRPAS